MLRGFNKMAAILVLLGLSVAGAFRGAAAIDAQSAPSPESAQVARSERGAIEVRGPYRLSPTLLKQLGRSIDPAPGPQMLTSPHDFPDEPDPCDERDCEQGADGGEGLSRARTPPPTGPVTDTTLGGLDPQIAASDTHLVITNGGGITFFNKSGKKVSKDRYGAPSQATFTTRAFFRPLWEVSNPSNINTFLNLPDGAVCDATTDSDYDEMGDGPFCLDSWYDTRVVFDTYRRRFWITALARNSNSRQLSKWDDESLMAPAYQLAARRTKVVTAVSLTDDPRDGWYLYWWDAVVEDGQCVSPSADSCAGTTNRPGDGADYPSIGISYKYLVQTNSVLRRDPDGTTTDDQGAFVNDWLARYSFVAVVSAEGLANGGCNGPCGWAYWDIRHPQDSNTTIVGSIQPAHAHWLAPFGRAYMTNTWGNALLVWGIDGTEFAPPLQVQVLPLDSPVSGIVNSDQPAAGTVTQPKKLTFSNLGNMVTRAYERNGLLHAMLPDCRIWESTQSTCSASLRLVRVNLAPFPGALVKDTYYIDRAFGLRNDFDDPADAVNGYGNPGLSVNGFGDIVAIYNRVGPTLFPEARYSAFMFNEPDIRPSALLRAGEFPWGQNDNDGKSGGNVDTGGSGVDPYDDTAVWLTQPYAFQSTDNDGNDKGAFALASGKVFGELHPDVVAYVTNLLAKRPVLLEPATFTIQLEIRNDGDGPVQEGRGQVVLSPDLAIGSSDHAAADFAFGAVPPGGSNFITVQVTTPDWIPAGTYYVGGRVTGVVGNPEYSAKNNVTFLKVGSKRVFHKLLIPIP